MIKKTKLQSLERALTLNRLGPNLLLIGTKEFQRNVAIWVAQNLLCTDRVQNRACEECPACVGAKALTLPELTYLGANESKVGIEAIRNIKHDFSHTSFRGGARVVYIQDLASLSIPAANALLKTLEEPSPKQYFILGAATLANVLPTISSRCQHFYVGEDTPISNNSENLLEPLLSEKQNDLRKLSAIQDRDWQNEVAATCHAIGISAREASIPQQRLAAHKMETLLNAQQKLSQNGNPKLTLEKLLLGSDSYLDTIIGT